MDKQCPYYQGVCGLDERYICFCDSNYKNCNIYGKHIRKLIDEAKNGNRMNDPRIENIELNCEHCDIYEPTEGNCRDCLIKALQGKQYGEKDV